MAIDFNPMNFQMIVPKSTEVGQVQHHLNDQVNIQQDFRLEKQREEDNIKDQTVQRHDETEDGRIKNDPDREKNQGGGRNARKRRQSVADDESDESLSELDEMNPPKSLDVARGNLIDIRL